MHVSKAALAGVTVLASHGSATYMALNQQSTIFGQPVPTQAVQERGSLSGRRALLEPDNVADIDYKGGPYTSDVISPEVSVNPEVPNDPTHYVVEVSYATKVKKTHIIPTIAPSADAEPGRQALPDFAENNIVVPTDATWSIHGSHGGGRFNPAGHTNHTPTTMKQQVRRRARGSDAAAALDTHLAEQGPRSTISTPLRCYESVARHGTESAKALCRPFGSPSPNDPQVQLFPDTEFLALGRHGEYVCDAAPATTPDGATIECRDRCEQCGGAGPGSSSGLTCKERCGWVDRRGEEKRKYEDDRYAFVLAGTAEDGLADFWCPEEMVVKGQTCVWVYPGQA